MSRGLQSAPEPALEAASPLLVQRYLAGLQERLKPISVYQHYRCFRTFFAWCVEAGLLQVHPMRSLAMKIPKTLPIVPDDDAVRRLLRVCPDIFEGRRNKALVAAGGIAGCASARPCTCAFEDLNFAARTIHVRGGKGGKDGVGFFGAESAQCLRAWLARCPEDGTDDRCAASGAARSRRGGTHEHRNLELKGRTESIGVHVLRVGVAERVA